MVTRLGCFLGRLSATGSNRAFSLQNSRCITSSALLWSNSEAKSPKPVATTATSSGGGLTGFLREKTGVTGAWTLGLGLSAYFLSKEFYVVDGETVIAVVFGSIIIYLMKKIGQPVAQFLDNKSQDIHDLLSRERNSRKASLQAAIEAESNVENDLLMRHDIFDILKENNAMRLEEEYRRRLHQVTNTVKRQLDYQVEVEQAQRKFEQEHMIQWLEKAVIELVKGKQDESFTQCMNDLKKMSVA